MLRNCLLQTLRHSSGIHQSQRILYRPILACRYSSSKLNASTKKVITDEAPSQKSTLSVFAEDILEVESDEESKTSDQFLKIESKLHEMDELIAQREQAYNTYLEDLERTESEDEAEDSDDEGKEYLEEVTIEEIKSKLKLEKTLQGDIMVMGTADPEVPMSDVPCPGCGAMLHCQKAGAPGFVASEIFQTSPARKLRKLLCQRCHMMRRHDIALASSMTPDDYRAIVSTRIKQKHGLVLLVVDACDFPNSVFDELGALIGEKRPLYIIANKVDLIAQDSRGHLDRVRAMIEEECTRQGWHQNQYIKHVALISAKTGYGVENLVSKLIKNWGTKDDIYVVGSTNVGKSTLFNKLIASDLCKSVARDFLARSTISSWPGTTLDLLQFPLFRPVPWKIRERAIRLEADWQEKKQREAKRLHKLNRSGDAKYAILTGSVRQTFQGEKRKLSDEEEYSGYTSASYSFDKESSSLVSHGSESRWQFQQKLFESRLREKEPKVFAKSKWCHDTPGVVNPKQIINRLTAEELRILQVSKVIRPRSYIVKPSQVILLTGLARLDYVQGPASVYFTVLSAPQLPVFVMDRDEADDFYRENVGTDTLALPVGRDRVASLPSLIGREFSVTGQGWRHSAADITLSSVGWVSVTAGTSMPIRVRAYTPGGAGMILRSPALLPHAVNLRGKRVGRSASHHIRPANKVWNDKNQQIETISSPLDKMGGKYEQRRN